MIKTCWEWFHPLRLGPTCTHYLKLLEVPDTSQEILAQCLAQNQATVHFLSAVLHARSQQMTHFEQPEVLTGAAIFKPLQIMNYLGRQGTRNFLLTLRKLRIVNKTLPRNSQMPLQVHPEDELAFALQLESDPPNTRLGNPYSAFKAGLLFDWLQLLIKQNFFRHKPTENFLARTWQDGLKMAAVSNYLVPSVRLLPNAQEVLPALYAILAGRFLLYCFATHKLQCPADKWGKWADKFTHLLVTAPERIPQHEQALFGISHQELAVQFLKITGLSAPLQLVLPRYLEPYLDNNPPSVSGALATVLYFCSLVSELKQKPVALSATVFQKKWLKMLNISIDDVKNLVPSLQI